MDDLWLEVTLPVPAAELERVCDILTANGMTGLVVEEEGEFLRFLEQNRQYWDYVDEEWALVLADEGKKKEREMLIRLDSVENIEAK